MDNSFYPLEEPGQVNRISEPCTLVIFGATGDLTARKLLPALYNLSLEGQISPHFACVGFARRTKTSEQFRLEMKEAITSFSRTKPISSSFWPIFEKNLFYHTSEFDDDEGYRKLKLFLEELDRSLGTRGNRIFYLSTQPSFFPLIAKKLHDHSLLYDETKGSDPWSRVIIEKPFGHNLSSAVALQESLLENLAENQIYRIDHYLGKETVQNLLVFRFANSLFESLWNSRYIEQVQITVAEEIGIGSRGKFFEEAGLLRDIIQNHVMQLLSLVAMEPPSTLSAEAIRDEKVKVVKAIRSLSLTDVVRGQYGPGLINGSAVKGYREEEQVLPTSSVETFVAAKLHIDNWRWSGVPFYIRSGKRLPKRATEIAVVFKTPPQVLFQTQPGSAKPNTLVIRIQPNEGISLTMNCKVPGPSSPIQPVKMDFRYNAFFGIDPPEAYERLICDATFGDSTLFAREDEVLASWKLWSPILDAPALPLYFYPSGSWGPKEAESLLISESHKWRIL